MKSDVFESILDVRVWSFLSLLKESPREAHIFFYRGRSSFWATALTLFDWGGRGGAKITARIAYNNDPLFPRQSETERDTKARLLLSQLERVLLMSGLEPGDRPRLEGSDLILEPGQARAVFVEKVVSQSGESVASRFRLRRPGAQLTMEIEHAAEGTRQVLCQFLWEALAGW